MMSKAPRWQDTLETSKANKAMQKKMGKESKFSVSCGKQQSNNSRSGVNVGRSHSFGTKDLSSGGKGGGSAQEQNHAGLKDTRTASRSSRSGIRLCSSRSFSSLHGSSFPAAPFVRGSHSLSRLDQRRRDEGKGLDSRKFSASLETLRDCKNYPLNTAGDMKTSPSDQSLESSSSVATCHHHSNKVKKQTRDGVYTLCAMTSGMRRNLVQAVLRNVRPSATPVISDTPAITDSSVEQSVQQQHSNSLDKENDENTEDSGDKSQQNSSEHINEQKHIKQSNAESATNQTDPVSALPPPISSTTPPINALNDQENIKPSSDHLVQNTENGVSNNARLNGELNALLKHNIETATAPEKDGQQSINNSSLCAQVEASGKHTGQLVKELEKTQKELSRLQQMNKILQDELLQEKEIQLKESRFQQKSDCQSNPASSLDQVALQRLQKTNQDLCAELEAQRQSQEEAREGELRRRVDLLAQQAQLLVTGDATALAQAQLELDRRRFKEKQLELEHIILSLKSNLQSSEEKRAKAENCLTQVQQEMQGLSDLQQEFNQLRENYQDVTSQLRVHEDTQAQKEARLEQHLLLLQASQERERRSLASSLAQAERRSQDLQEQLGRAEEQVENLHKTQEWTKEIQEAQEQLQEELQKVVSAMQEVQEEKEQLENQCQELQSQVSELNSEVSRLQDRLQTDKTQFYNLEHSYERVCEELQVAMGKLCQRETEAEEMREGYERQLDQKEQELTEVLLKMEVLGNSLEETEMRLNEVLEKKETEKKLLINKPENISVDGTRRLRSRSIDQSLIPDEDDPEKFASIIQVLETKLYVTEEKLRDITQRLEDYQSHVSCQDPLLCSQLTQTRANAQHLGLLLHSQAKNNQRFAQEMENRCRMLVGRFQVALNIVQACRGRLQEAGSLIDVEDFEKQLATLVNCLKQGEKHAEKQQHESRYASREEERILNDRTLTESLHLMEDVPESVSKSLSREIFVVETMVTLLQSKNVFSQLQAIQKENEGSLSQQYQSLLTQMKAIKAQSRNEGLVESAVSSACVEAELVFMVFKFQQQNSNLEEIQPSELESYDEHAEKDDRSVQRQSKANDQTKHPIKVEELVSTLLKRATFLRQLSQDIPETISHDITDSKWIHEQAKLIYLTHKLYLDFQQESDNQGHCSEQEVNETLCHLEEVNCVLREELEHAEQRVRIVETGNEKLLEDIQKIESYHEERMQKLEQEFQEKIHELQRIHEEEMKHLHDYYSMSCFSKEKLNKTTGKSASNPSENGAESNTEEQDKSERFSALEEMHKKLISDMQQQHQKELSKLLKEKDQLLKEETAATMAAIVAMRRAHKDDLEKTRRTTNIRENADTSELHIEYEKELKTLNKDLELLSVQHTHKCLENSHLSQKLQKERKTLMQYQLENQELKKKQRETEDDSPLLSLNGKHIPPDGNDPYEMEVILRAREAEMQFLQQEAQSLKEELKLAQMDTIYAQNKLKSLCMGTPDEKLYDDLKSATWSPGRPGQSQMFSEEAGTHQRDATVQNKSGGLSLPHQLREVKSKSLKEGRSVKEWTRLFES
ncbi:uncharacterized protein [Eucyclogobius newberryi]|uniref:uncharacterized protein n=1 Tax=Eucyclogobius newberryi TaxID=166745 RepID=UPI003B5BB9B1